MGSLVELVPDAGLVRLGATVHPCLVGPQGHLTVYGRELRPLTLGECDLIAAYGGGSGPEAAAAFARRMAGVDGDASAARLPGGDEAAGQAAVEAVALYLAGAAGEGPLRGASAALSRQLGVPLPDALAMTVLAADSLVGALPAEPSAGTGWTTFVIVGNEPDGPVAEPITDETAEVRRVRDVLARRLARRLADAPDVAADPAPGFAATGPGSGGPGAVPSRDRWGAPLPVEPVGPRATGGLPAGAPAGDPRQAGAPGAGTAGHPAAGPAGHPAISTAGHPAAGPALPAGAAQPTAGAPDGVSGPLLEPRGRGSAGGREPWGMPPPALPTWSGRSAGLGTLSDGPPGPPGPGTAGSRPPLPWGAAAWGPQGWGPATWGPQGWGPATWGPQGWGPATWGPRAWDPEARDAEGRGTGTLDEVERPADSAPADPETVDAIALRLALDLQALADLHGVAR